MNATTTRSEQIKNQLRTLLRDHGYTMEGATLIQKAIRGFCSARVVGRFRDTIDACEWLIPVIREDGFSDRLRKIMQPAD